MKVLGTLAVLGACFLLSAPASPPSDCDGQQVTWVAKETLTVRARPAAASDSIGFFPKDASVPVVGCGVEWCEVRSELIRGYLPESLLAAAPIPAPQVRSAPTPAPAPRKCCKICRKGKACGNSCIARNKTCHQPPGCACNG